MNTNEKTGNKKCWSLIDTRDMIRIWEGLTRRYAMAHGGGHFVACRDGYKLVQCWSAAHANAYIDNCSVCAPRWGWVMVPDVPNLRLAGEQEVARLRSE